MRGSQKRYQWRGRAEGQRDHAPWSRFRRGASGATRGRGGASTARMPAWSHPNNGASGPVLDALLLAATPLEIGLDERIQVTVEHGVDVAGLVARPLVLHERVRREGVRADLAAEGDVALLPRDLHELVGAFLAHPFGEAGGEDLHRACLVLRL